MRYARLQQRDQIVGTSLMVVPHLSFSQSYHRPTQTGQQTIAIVITTRQIMLGHSGARVEGLIDLHSDPHVRTLIYQNHQIRTDQRQGIRHTDAHVVSERQSLWQLLTQPLTETGFQPVHLMATVLAKRIKHRSRLWKVQYRIGILYHSIKPHLL